MEKQAMIRVEFSLEETNYGWVEISEVMPKEAYDREGNYPLARPIIVWNSAGFKRAYKKFAKWLKEVDTTTTTLYDVDAMAIKLNTKVNFAH